MRNGAGFSHVDGVASHRQPGRDDIAEGDYLGNLAIQGYPQHAVMVPICNEEPVVEGFDCVLESARDEEFSCWRMGYRPRPDVGYDAKVFWTVHAVDADDIMAPEVWGDAGDQRVRGPAEEGDIDYPATDEVQAR